MSTYLRIVGALVMLVCILLCAFVLPFAGWPLWYALSVVALQIFSICGLCFFAACGE